MGWAATKPENKYEVIQFTATRGRNRVENVTLLQVSNTSIKPLLTIKTLGVMTRNSCLKSTLQTRADCYGHIRALHHVRASLPDEVAKLSPAAS